MSKSLRKSRPCRERTTEVKAWSVGSRRQCAGTKKDAIRMKRTVGAIGGSLRNFDGLWVCSDLEQGEDKNRFGVDELPGEMTP